MGVRLWRLLVAWSRSQRGTGVCLVVWYAVSYLPYVCLNHLISVRVGLEHGADIAAVERGLGIPQSLYGVWSGPVWSAVYELPHMVMLLAFVPVVIVFRRDVRWRALAQVALLLVCCDAFWVLWPAAPPWLLYGGGAMPISSGIAQYATMPSYHVALAAVVARYFPRVGRPYAVCMTVIVVLTGNHYVLDAVAGWFVEWAAFAAVLLGGDYLRLRRLRARLRMVVA